MTELFDIELFDMTELFEIDFFDFFDIFDMDFFDIFDLFDMDFFDIFDIKLIAEATSSRLNELEALRKETTEQFQSRARMCVSV